MVFFFFLSTITGLINVNTKALKQDMTMRTEKGTKNWKTQTHPVEIGRSDTDAAPPVQAKDEYMLKLSVVDSQSQSHSHSWFI